MGISRWQGGARRNRPTGTDPGMPGRTGRSGWGWGTLYGSLSYLSGYHGSSFTFPRKVFIGTAQAFRTQWFPMDYSRRNPKLSFLSSWQRNPWKNCAILQKIKNHLIFCSHYGILYLVFYFESRNRFPWEILLTRDDLVWHIGNTRVIFRQDKILSVNGAFFYVNLIVTFL